VHHPADLDLGRLVLVKAEEAEELAIGSSPEKIGLDVRVAGAQHRELELEPTAVAGQADGLERGDGTQVVCAEPAGDLEAGAEVLVEAGAEVLVEVVVEVGAVFEVV
jgi:hypothetical protein